MGLSNLGIFHTAIGIIAIGAALVSYVKYRKINLAGKSGIIYFVGTVITSVTALGLSKHRGFNPGHLFSLLVLVLVLVALFLYAQKKGNTKARYFETFCLSFSFFLSLVPTVNETFTRVPVGNPLAKDASDPLIGKTLLVLLVLFVAGAVYQLIQQRKINKG
ncbi:hypothetical protein [Parachryseolinea silvisoli]|uniref:hypothetical protein n=1 Tax=Parachryseolinea silvisoli TaxID=2873601 RepID=UPI002265C800|nr:hypothetical protein [Parachryseolinea silvisoli]MCD9015092.1 hypothetical protein [Parachryseolinea silvisoli]